MKKITTAEWIAWSVGLSLFIVALIGTEVFYEVYPSGVYHYFLLLAFPAGFALMWANIQRKKRIQANRAQSKPLA